MSPTERQILCSTAQAVMTKLWLTSRALKNSDLQHAKDPLYNGTGLGVIVVEAALHPPLQWFSICGDDGHRHFNTG